MTKFEKIRNAAFALMGPLVNFMPYAQRKTLMIQIRRGEEKEAIADLILSALEQIKSCPVTRGSDPEQPMANLHYFMGGTDAWISERDVGDEFDGDGMGEQWQAFGKISLNGYDPELGYISIQELIENGVELDLHWTPKPLSECGK